MTIPRWCVYDYPCACTQSLFLCILVTPSSPLPLPLLRSEASNPPTRCHITIRHCGPSPTSVSSAAPQLDLVSVVEALAVLGPTAMGKAMIKHKGAIVVSLPRTSTRPGMKVRRRAFCRRGEDSAQTFSH